MRANQQQRGIARTSFILQSAEKFNLAQLAPQFVY